MKKRLIDILVAFMFGLSIFLFIGAYTRSWTESTPTDATVANQIDDYNRYLRVDVAERLEDYIGGFNASDSNAGFYHLLLLENAASLSTPAANKGLVYGVLANSKCELAYEDEDGDMIQLTTGGNIGGAHLELLANMDLLGSSTSDITINTNKFTVAGATGNTVIAGTLSAGVSTLADTSALATSGAPAADAQIANKKYVDDQIAAEIALDASDFAGTDGYAHMSDGFIIQWGEVSGNNSAEAVTFSLEFPTACIQVIVGAGVSGSGGSTLPSAYTFSTTGCTIYVPSGATPIRWIAVGN